PNLLRWVPALPRRPISSITQTTPTPPCAATRSSPATVESSNPDASRASPIRKHGIAEVSDACGLEADDDLRTALASSTDPAALRPALRQVALAVSMADILSCLPGLSLQSNIPNGGQFE